MSAFNQHLGELTEHFKEIESSETKLREKLEVVLCRAYRLQNRSNNSPFVPATRGEWNTLFFNPDLLDKKFVLSPDNVYIPTPASTKKLTEAEQKRAEDEAAKTAADAVAAAAAAAAKEAAETNQKQDIFKKYNDLELKLKTISDEAYAKSIAFSTELEKDKIKKTNARENIKELQRLDQQGNSQDINYGELIEAQEDIIQKINIKNSEEQFNIKKLYNIGDDSLFKKYTYILKYINTTIADLEKHNLSANYKDVIDVLRNKNIELKTNYDKDLEHYKAFIAIGKE